jgi:excisionase family DNA binding protein
MQEKELYSMSEVAAIAKVCERTIQRLTQHGALQTIRIGRRVFLPKSQLDLLLRQGATLNAAVDGVLAEAREYVGS